MKLVLNSEKIHQKNPDFGIKGIVSKPASAVERAFLGSKQNECMYTEQHKIF